MLVNIFPLNTFIEIPIRNKDVQETIAPNKYKNDITNPLIELINLPHYKKLLFTKEILSDLQLLDHYFDKQLIIDGKYINIEKIDKWKGFKTCKYLFDEGIIDTNSNNCKSLKISFVNSNFL